MPEVWDSRSNRKRKSLPWVGSSSMSQFGWSFSILARRRETLLREMHQNRDPALQTITSTMVATWM